MTLASGEAVRSPSSFLLFFPKVNLGMNVFLFSDGIDPNGRFLHRQLPLRKTAGIDRKVRPGWVALLHLDAFAKIGSGVRSEFRTQPESVNMMETSTEFGEIICFVRKKMTPWGRGQGNSIANSLGVSLRVQKFSSRH